MRDDGVNTGGGASAQTLAIAKAAEMVVRAVLDRQDNRPVTYESIKSIFANLGIDIEDPKDMKSVRQSLDHLRSNIKFLSQLKSGVTITVIGSVLVAVVIFLINYFGHIHLAAPG